MPFTLNYVFTLSNYSEQDFTEHKVDGHGLNRAQSQDHTLPAADLSREAKGTLGRTGPVAGDARKAAVHTQNN